jgi:RNA polymerase sigma factor (sigma-70 family)
MQLTRTPCERRFREWESATGRYRQMVIVKDADPIATRARDSSLVASCLKGNEEAWVELWTRYGPVVKAVARRTGCDAEEAKDVLQRVALAALQGLDRLRDPEKLGGWLAGTARYQSFEVIRTRRATDQLYPGVATSTEDHEQRLQLDRDLIHLRKAMLELDERCRRLIRRLALKEPPDTYRDVAAAEGLAPSSIGPIRRRCVQKLGKIVGRLSHRPHRTHPEDEK